MIRTARSLRGRFGGSRRSYGSFYSIKTTSMLYGATVACIFSIHQQNAACDEGAFVQVPAAKQSNMSLVLREDVNIHFVKRYFQWLMLHLRVLLRSIFLMMNYSVPLATAPAAFLVCDDEHRHWWWEILRSCIRQAGPCSTKMAQWAATRPDLFPMEVVRQLSELQVRAFHHSESSTRKMLEEAFGQSDLGVLDVPPDSLQGCGSVASVYRGTLTRCGETKPVAVKVIHPGVRQTIAADLSVLRAAVNVVTAVLPFDPVGLHDSLNQFASMMNGQLDMRVEAAALRRFITAFEDQPRVKFPVPYDDFVRRDILVETFEEGPSSQAYLPDREGLSELGTEDDRRGLARIGLDCVLKMVFEGNFCHADMHPGNVIIRGEPGQGARNLTWVVIDAGITAELHTSDRRNFVELFKAVVMNDGRRAGRLIMDRSLLGYEGCVDPDGFENALHTIVNECHHKGLSLGRLGVAELISRVLALCFRHRVRLDPSFTQLVLGVAVVDGLGRRLDPDIDLLRAAAPYVLKIASELSL